MAEQAWISHELCSVGEGEEKKYLSKSTDILLIILFLGYVVERRKQGARVLRETRKNKIRPI